MKSNSDIFAERGDPWVSERQGYSDYGRNLDTENPDLDMHTRAKKAKERHEKGSEKRGKGRDPATIKQVALRMKARKLMRPAVLQTARVVEHRIAPTLRSASVVAKSRLTYFLYVKMSDGSEEEMERKTLKAAESSYRRLVKKEGVSVVELWCSDGRLLSG